LATATSLREVDQIVAEILPVSHSAIAGAMAAGLEREISVRIGYRRWYRNNYPTWTDLAAENAVILRALLRVRNRARRAALAELDRWQENELRASWGDR
jgi:hypothetical protein